MIRYAHIVLTPSLFCLLFFNFLTAQQITPSFERLTVEDGLPQNSVTCIIQDHLGFLWFGTQNGLVKYDGYSIKTFRPVVNDSNSISQPSILTLFEEKSGKIWVGTRKYKDGGGLNCFDPATEKFTRFMHNPNDSTSISSDYVLCIYQDESERLWIGTDKGLSLFDPQSKTFNNYYLLYSTSIDLGDVSESAMVTARIGSIIEDRSTGNILIGSDVEGLWVFDVNQRIFSNYNIINKEASEIGSITFVSAAFSSNAFCYTSKKNILFVSSRGLFKLDTRSNNLHRYGIIQSQNQYNEYNLISVLEDNNGLIWVGTDGNGVLVFDPIKDHIQHYHYASDNTNQFAAYTIPSLYEDNSGIIWVGSNHQGLFKWDRKKWQFKHFRNDPENPNSLSRGIVSSILVDKNGILWIGTFGGGLNKYDPKTSDFKKLHINQDNSNGLSDDWITALIEDPSDTGILWIGATGLMKLDLKSGAITRFELNPYKNKGASQVGIQSLCIDSKGTLWAGSWGHGLFKFDRKSNTYIHIRFDPNDSTSISQDLVSVIYEDRAGRLWIGTDTQGINLLNPETGKFIRFKSLQRDGQTASIVSVYEDQKGNFWIGTLRSGLHLFDREKGITIKNFTETDGLANNFVTAILEDESGNLWLSTENGLSKFDPQKNTFINYYSKDGLKQNIFFQRSAFKSVNGKILFGGMNGFNIFHPDSIKNNQIPPKVVIGNVSLIDKSVEAIKFDGFLPELNELNLSYDQNDLRFDYVGLHYSEPEKNQYKYKLENFNDNWINAGTQRNATYTNLDPGEYIFIVKAANRDGIWNEEGASIRIIILPPWWATTWAYILYAILILSIIYFTWKLQLKRIRIKHDYEMSKFEADKMHEVDEIKSRFFANISHEFRTPLTLIFGPAKDVLEKSDDPHTKKNVGIIKRNASRLYSLVNQLLDLSKLEAGKMKLEASEQDIIHLLKGIFLSFTSFAERKKISLQFNTIVEELNVYIDKEKVEKIINNLLSNAFKFTPEGGRIEFTVEKLLIDAEIRITDNGIGIPEERLEKIFDRFYQVNGSQTRVGEGTGIGLALTKELVELHKGKIKVQSKEGEGTTFTVQLPLGKDHIRPEEFVEKEIQEEIPETREEIELISERENRKEKTDIDVLLETDKPLLLIVEDNSDVRSYIISHLEGDYGIQEAIDGEDGLNRAVKHIPDLIISDVMMPKMDGFEMCDKLKTDERTSHIPIIMLTAKATSKDKIEGYETGADDYIMKPFEATELKARVNNLIEIRKKLRDSFKKEGLIEIDDKDLTSMDKTFLKKATSLINEHISDSTFSVDMLADEMGMSRSQLFRKLLGLVGESPSEIIRKVRLTKAAKLLEQRFGNISEIALEVGFNNPSSFARSFTKQFGVPPSEYEKKK